MQITDAHVQEYQERGFIILRNYLPEQKRAQLAAALRRVIKPWDEVKDNPPEDRSGAAGFPYPEQVLNELIVDPQIVAFARRVLGTEEIQYRAGMSLARYPGFTLGGDGWHIDNGNNSLLPLTESDPAYAQLTVWWHFEDVDADQAPIYLIPKKYGNDTSKAEPATVPGGSLLLFNNYLWHSASDYQRADGQRYSLGYMFGRADHPWEGFKHYTSQGQGQNPHFRTFIGSLTPSQRELFRFPPVGHPYYTPQTLAALEEQYPGWKAQDYLKD
jgi:hypothetical protein